MIKITGALLVSLLFFVPPHVLAQRYQPLDSEEGGFEDYMSWLWEGSFRPFLEATIGNTQPQHQVHEAELTKIGIIEGKLGYSEIEPYKRFAHSLDERYVYGSYLEKDLRFVDKDERTGNVDTKYIRFGVGNRLGFGYKVGPTRLLLYNQNALAWTEMESERPEGLAQSDIDILDRYENFYRFGTLAEAGLKFDLFKSFYANASLEGAVIFPRHIFWEWLGSAMLQYGALGAISAFSERIVDSHPIIGPLLFFVLKNGVSYLFYMGMQDDMNWPFTSEAPLTLESFKLSAGIAF